MAEADTRRADASPHAIGDWTFHPADNELRGPLGKRRLEHRAARTLELLCARRGALVSRDEIVREVWEGRLVSPNSVSIVISDLREALGDDARSPRHIETVAKRGYRLTGGAAAPAPEKPRLRPLILGLLLLVVVVAGLLFALSGGRSTQHTILVVAAVENATGSPAWQPLADASSEVLLNRARAIDGPVVMREPAAGERVRPRGDDAPVVRLSARLILWSGKPTVMFTATDADSRAVIWNGMTGGGEDLIPSGTAAAMQDLAKSLTPD
jgi:DNA-binding winged helix-turn-helix (wHTH) protein